MRKKKTLFNSFVTLFITSELLFTNFSHCLPSFQLSLHEFIANLVMLSLHLSVIMEHAVTDVSSSINQVYLLFLPLQNWVFDLILQPVGHFGPLSVSFLSKEKSKLKYSCSDIYVTIFPFVFVT